MKSKTIDQPTTMGPDTDLLRELHERDGASEQAREIMQRFAECSSVEEARAIFQLMRLHFSVDRIDAKTPNLEPHVRDKKIHDAMVWQGIVITIFAERQRVMQSMSGEVL